MKELKSRLTKKLSNLSQQQPKEEGSEPNYNNKPEGDMLQQIKDKPVPKGACETKICGEVVDWSALERYTLNISPADLKTAIRQNEAKLWGMYQKYRSPTAKAFGSSKMIILIILAVGLMLLGLIVMMFLPEIMAMFGGGL